jgi:hypothetical protein
MDYYINFDQDGPTEEEKRADIEAIKAGEYEFSHFDLDKKWVLEYLWHEEGMRYDELAELLDIRPDMAKLVAEWYQLVVYPGPPLMMSMNYRRPWQWLIEEAKKAEAEE